jgi:hypothetical protein
VLRFLSTTRELLLDRKPDTLICATGAHYDTTGFSPYRPDRDFIPGYEQSNVVELAAATRTALTDPRSLGRKIVILDETAAYLPFGLAELLAVDGKAEVEVITPHMFAAEDVFRTSGDALFVSAPQSGRRANYHSTFYRENRGQSGGGLRYLGRLAADHYRG